MDKLFGIEQELLIIKIIISHDVDHLFGKEHWFLDLFYQKLFVRESVALLQRRITVHEWKKRCASCFQYERNHIKELIKFENESGVPSTFFFGMAKGLGMSYTPEEARDMIWYVLDQGFDVGIHGINFTTLDGIVEERMRFEKIVGFSPSGIRIHYVRFNDETFTYENEAGYLFDATEFCKVQGGTFKAPYKIGKMWEFPLTIMDSYLPQEFEKAREETQKRLTICQRLGLEYMSVLFHDYQFCDAYLDINKWFRWFIEYINKSPDYSFCTYGEAIEELENDHNEE